MKNVNGILTAATFVFATFGTQLNAGNTKLNVLSENEWQQIEETVELEDALAFEDVTLNNTSEASTLQVEFQPGNFTNTLYLLLNAPFNENQEVGIAVVDADGEVVHSAAGSFSEIKKLSFDLYSKWDMTYVVRIYSDDTVYETSVQVVYR